jgi:RNase P/RNase MRP subunit p29
MNFQIGTTVKIREKATSIYAGKSGKIVDFVANMKMTKASTTSMYKIAMNESTFSWEPENNLTRVIKEITENDENQLLLG